MISHKSHTHKTLIDHEKSYVFSNKPCQQNLREDGISNHQIIYLKKTNFSLNLYCMLGRHVVFLWSDVSFHVAEGLVWR